MDERRRTFEPTLWDNVEALNADEALAGNADELLPDDDEPAETVGDGLGRPLLPKEKSYFKRPLPVGGHDPISRIGEFIYLRFG